MNAGELLKALNDVVTCPEFRHRLSKVHDHKSFHELVREYAKAVLTFDVKFGTWQILFPSLPFSHKFISYNRTFVPYKNSPRGDRGTFSDVAFELASDLFPTQTLEEVTYRLRTIYANDRIHNLKESVIKHMQGIELCQKHIAEFEAELSEIRMRTKGE